MNHRGPTVGVPLWTSVTLYACRQTRPSLVCDRYGSGGATDSGTYEYYAGRVFVNAPDRCIHVEGAMTYRNTAHFGEIMGASHCS